MQGLPSLQEGKRKGLFCTLMRNALPGPHIPSEETSKSSRAEEAFLTKLKSPRMGPLGVTPVPTPSVTLVAGDGWDDPEGRCPHGHCARGSGTRGPEEKGLLSDCRQEAGLSHPGR